MSSAVSALNGASARGFVTVTEAGPRGMITLRGDLSLKKLQNAATKLTGTAFPEQGRCVIEGESGIAWMSPDELLILCPYDQARDITERLVKAMGTTHHLAANVSDARAMFTLQGVDIREALAKLTPADLSPAAFAPGQFRRSRVAQVPAAFWMNDDETLHLICFRSVAQYMFDLLNTASLPGSEVGYF